MMSIFSNLSLAAKAGFSTTKSYASTFKIRSRLGDFFKHVHPDQLHQAPTKVKEENLRSLTNFNAYIDAINQGKPIEGRLLKFYLSEKTNLKSKKFYSFAVELPTIDANQSNMPEEKARKLVDNIVEVLNRKFLESKLGKQEGKGKEKIDGIDADVLKQRENRDQKFHRMVSKITPFDRKAGRISDEERQLQRDLNAKYIQADKDALTNTLKRSISFADTRSNKPMMWSRFATEESGVFKDFQSIFDELIDPRLIYFHESLTLDQIEMFKKNILPGSLDRTAYNDFKLIAQVCSKMEAEQPPICFYVHTKYSGSDIPGFFTVPFNFKAKDLHLQFEKYFETILEERQKYEQYYDYYCQLRQQLRCENQLYVQQANFTGNDEIWMRILALKRLQKHAAPVQTTVVILSAEELSLFKSSQAIQQNLTAFPLNGKLIVSTDFGDEDVAVGLQGLNK